jgi:hypothetical protein
MSKVYHTPVCYVHGSIAALTHDHNPCKAIPKGVPVGKGDAKPDKPDHDCFQRFSHS